MNSEAQFAMRVLGRALASLSAATVLASCGGPSSYHNSANPPQAVAHAVGALATSAAGADPVAITVRAQSQVTLTGNASSGGDAAIGTFTWTQADAVPVPQVVLLFLDSDTVTFTAPAVGADTTLHFTLTVTTAGNAAASAHVAVLVKAINDPNQFLAPLAAQHYFKVAVSTKEGLGPLATPAAPLAADVPVCVAISRTIDYLGRDGIQHSVSLPKLQADSAWVAAVGGAASAFGSYTNPRVAFTIPALNQDDLAVLFNNPVPNETSAAAATRLAQQLVPSDIDSARLSLTATAAAGSCDGTLTTTALASKTLQVQVLDQDGNTVGAAADGSAAGGAAVTAAFTGDTLVSQLAGQYETADTARAYYDANDPGGTKTSLTKWLDANCFTSTAVNYGAAAHSVYTNNYDLGFGRDMYFATCTAGSTAVTKGLAKVGDMAAVVINYASLEAAASKLSPINAVAMEYSAATDGSNPTRRFPKFYIFAPNDRDGTYRRVLSANFDHRGEKFVPGACAMCHGGTLPTFPKPFVHVAATDAKYVEIDDPTSQLPTLGLGDIDSSFMPWDLDSFLYSSAPQPANSDPSFVGLSVDASQYTRSAQEPNLKKLNQLAYCTYQPEIESVNSTNVDRFAGSRQLVAQWYGGSGQPDAGCPGTGNPTATLLPNGTYDDSGTPALWTAQATPAKTTLTSDMIYHQLLARNCRACHTQSQNIAQQFTDYSSFVKFLQPANSVLGLGTQYVFQQGRMPMARLTMDRFWVDYSGGDSAAKILATHAQQINAGLSGQPPLLDSGGNAIAPGNPPLANVAVNGSLVAAGGPSLTVTRYAGATADALSFASVSVSPSFFIADYQWSLCLVPTAGGNCAAQPLVGAKSATPGFDTSASGTYQLSLAADNGFGVSTTPQFDLLVKQTAPKFTASCPSTVNAQINTPAPVDLGPASAGGDDCIVPGDGANTLQIQDPSTLAWVSPTSAAPLTSGSGEWNASISGYTINFEYLAVPTTPASFNYRVVDVDGLMTPPGNLEFLYLTTLSPLSFQIHLSNVLGVVPAADSGGNYPLSTTALLQGLPPVEVSSLSIVNNATAGNVSPPSILPSAQFTYTVPASQPVMCDVNGKSISNINSACGGDPFSYTATVGGSNLNTVTITMQVLATTSFWQSTSGASSGIYGMLGGTQCATCHDPSSGMHESAATDHWTYTSSGTLASKSTATWKSVTGVTPPITSTPAVITVGNPTSSALFTNPCQGTNGHGINGSAAQKLTAQQCNILKQWIVEGANYD